MDIILSQSVNLVNGDKTTAIIMREPTPRDLLNLSNIKQLELKELTLLSNLTTIEMESIKDMPISDYKRLQKALEKLQEGDESISPKG